MDISALAETIAALGNKMGGNYDARLVELCISAQYEKTRVLRESLANQMEKTNGLLDNSEKETLKTVIQTLDELTEPDKEYWGEIKVLFSDKIEGLTVSYYKNDCSGTVRLNGDTVASCSPDFSRNSHMLYDDTGRTLLFQDFTKIMEIAEQYVEDSFDIKPQKRQSSRYEQELE